MVEAAHLHRRRLWELRSCAAAEVAPAPANYYTLQMHFPLQLHLHCQRPKHMMTVTGVMEEKLVVEPHHWCGSPPTAVAPRASFLRGHCSSGWISYVGCERCLRSMQLCAWEQSALARTRRNLRHDGSRPPWYGRQAAGLAIASRASRRVRRRVGARRGASRQVGWEPGWRINIYALLRSFALLFLGGIGSAFLDLHVP